MRRLISILIISSILASPALAPSIVESQNGQLSPYLRNIAMDQTLSMNEALGLTPLFSSLHSIDEHFAGKTRHAAMAPYDRRQGLSWGPAVMAFFVASLTPGIFQGFQQPASNLQYPVMSAPELQQTYDNRALDPDLCRRLNRALNEDMEDLKKYERERPNLSKHVEALLPAIAAFQDGLLHNPGTIHIPAIPVRAPGAVVLSSIRKMADGRLVAYSRLFLNADLVLSLLENSTARTAIASKEGATILAVKNNPQLYDRYDTEIIEFGRAPFDINQKESRELAKRAAAKLIEEEAIGIRMVIDLFDVTGTPAQSLEKQARSASNFLLAGALNRFFLILKAAGNKTGEQREYGLKRDILANEIRGVSPSLYLAIQEIIQREGDEFLVDPQYLVLNLAPADNARALAQAPSEIRRDRPNGEFTSESAGWMAPLEGRTDRAEEEISAASSDPMPVVGAQKQELSVDLENSVVPQPIAPSTKKKAAKGLKMPSYGKYPDLGNVLSEASKAINDPSRNPAFYARDHNSLETGYLRTLFIQLRSQGVDGKQWLGLLQRIAGRSLRLDERVRSMTVGILLELRTSGAITLEPVEAAADLWLKLLEEYKLSSDRSAYGWMIDASSGEPVIRWKGPYQSGAYLAVGLLQELGVDFTATPDQGKFPARGVLRRRIEASLKTTRTALEKKNRTLFDEALLARVNVALGELSIPAFDPSLGENLLAKLRSNNIPNRRLALAYIADRIGLASQRRKNSPFEAFLSSLENDPVALRRVIEGIEASDEQAASYACLILSASSNDPTVIEHVLGKTLAMRYAPLVKRAIAQRADLSLGWLSKRTSEIPTLWDAWERVFSQVIAGQIPIHDAYQINQFASNALTLAGAFDSSDFFLKAVMGYLRVHVGDPHAAADQAIAFIDDKLSWDAQLSRPIEVVIAKLQKSRTLDASNPGLQKSRLEKLKELARRANKSERNFTNKAGRTRSAKSPLNQRLQSSS